MQTQRKRKGFLLRARRFELLLWSAYEALKVRLCDADGCPVLTPPVLLVPVAHSMHQISTGDPTPEQTELWCSGTKETPSEPPSAASATPRRAKADPATTLNHSSEHDP